MLWFATMYFALFFTASAIIISKSLALIACTRKPSKLNEGNTRPDGGGIEESPVSSDEYKALVSLAFRPIVQFGVSNEVWGIIRSGTPAYALEFWNWLFGNYRWGAWSNAAAIALHAGVGRSSVSYGSGRTGEPAGRGLCCVIEV